MYGDEDPDQAVNNKENDHIKSKCFNILPSLFR